MNFREHVEKWLGCDKCRLHEGRGRMVFARGQIPCDVLLVGEAPGDSEDVSGLPFDGPAGHLLDEVVKQSGIDRLRLCLTNLVCCFPREEKEAGINEPPESAVLACQPRLLELITLARPRLIVAVGTLARDWLDQKKRKALRLPLLCSVCGRPQRATKSGPTCEDGHGGADGLETPQVFITHPAAVLRAPTAQKGLMRQRMVVTLANAVEALE